MKVPVFIAIDYEEFEPDTYAGVFATFLDGEVIKIINTGDAKSDLKSMELYLKEKGYHQQYRSSSCDNYFFDMNQLH